MQAPVAQRAVPTYSPDGLTDEQVEASRAEHGANVFPETKKVAWWREYLEGFTDPTIVILMAAAVLSILLGLISGKPPYDGFAILIAVIIATSVSFFNEYRAEADFERLRSIFEQNVAIVTRNGTQRKVTFDQIVVGDVVILSAGMLVPADGVIVRSANLAIDTAPIDGESIPKDKGVFGDPFDPHEDPDYGELRRGHRVVGGTAEMVVTAVGQRTMMWVHVMARMEQAREDEHRTRTPLEERLDRLAGMIGRGGLMAAILIFMALVARSLLAVALGQTLSVNGEVVNTPIDVVYLVIEYLLIAITVVVVAVPEGLPLAVTVSLAMSARNIARDNNLVRKPKATETIGQANVICTDKTGTLTENRMIVQRVYVHGERFNPSRVSAMGLHPAMPMLALSAALNSTASLGEKEGRIEYIGNATEAALLAWLDMNGQSYNSLRDRAILHEQTAFSSSAKMMISVVSLDGRGYLLVKGAPEMVLETCRTVDMPGGAVPLADRRVEIDAELASMTDDALRTLALAYAPIPEDESLANYPADIHMPDLTLLAIVGMADPIRPDVPEAIRECLSAGIDVKMITGDNPKTAQAIAQELNLVDEPEQVVLANDFRTMPPEAKRESALKLRVLARAIPSDKEDLVQILQAERLVVAVTGDGVNDGPALQRADVGIAMGIRGTDIAKQAADIVLLDDNFGSLVKAVHWGRALFENIQRFLQYQLTINVSALAIVFFATLLGLTDQPGEPPLTVIQLLWINLIMDTLAVIALIREPPIPEQMQRKPKGRTDPFVTPIMRTNIVAMSAFFTVVILGLIAALHTDGNFSVEDQTIVFTSYVFFQIFNEINARSLDPRISPFRGILKNRSFLSVIAFIGVVQFILVQSGGVIGLAFHTTPLSLETWILIVLGASTAVLFSEILRLIRRGRMGVVLEKELKTGGA
ncbi:MAG TPA: calcium-translocating P-type ATPase, PMCA-type [Aggregatilineales bacterium]|nr:calcium-translocating P-type ATPase, PMCA-type [Aggregatilineales bacterium]